MVHDLLITAMQLFCIKLTASLFCFPLFYRPKKVSFVVNYRVFQLVVASNRCALIPAVRRYLFC